MANSFSGPLANARRIIQCTPVILRAGIRAECAACDVASCRQRLARYLPAAARTAPR